MPDRLARNTWRPNELTPGIESTRHLPATRGLFPRAVASGDQSARSRLIIRAAAWVTFQERAVVQFAFFSDVATNLRLRITDATRPQRQSISVVPVSSKLDGSGTPVVASTPSTSNCKVDVPSGSHIGGWSNPGKLSFCSP